MRERLTQITAWIDGRALRERVLILVTGAVMIVAVADLAVFGGMRAAMERLSEQETGIRKSIAESSDQVGVLRDKLEQDPNADVRERIETLKDRMARVEGRLADQRRELIEPAEMVALLRGLVTEDEALELVSVRSHSPEVLERFAAEGSSDAVPGQVYRHGVSLVLTGRFPDAVGYLRAVEDLPWRLFWDGMDIEVTEYPRTRIRLRLHTLSLDEDWIGV